MRILFAPVRTVYGGIMQEGFQLTKYFCEDQGGGGVGIERELPYISHLGFYQCDLEIRVWFSGSLVLDRV